MLAWHDKCSAGDASMYMRGIGETEEADHADRAVIALSLPKIQSAATAAMLLLITLSHMHESPVPLSPARQAGLRPTMGNVNQALRHR